MTYLDLALLIVMGGFVLAGFWFGFIHMVGSMLGLIVGSVAAGRLYPIGAAWLAPFITNENVARALAFFVIFVVATKLVGLVFWIVERGVRFLSIIPFFRMFDRLLGTVLGLVEGTAALGLMVWFVARFPFSSAFAQTMQASSFVKPFYAVGAALSVLLPAALKAMQSVV
jgi:uncharacterized membrane protein required for colicin V production